MTFVNARGPRDFEGVLGIHAVHAARMTGSVCAAGWMDRLLFRTRRFGGSASERRRWEKGQVACDSLSLHQVCWT
jgi:hypothetical protein